MDRHLADAAQTLMSITKHVPVRIEQAEEQGERLVLVTLEYPHEPISGCGPTLGDAVRDAMLHMVQRLA